jgi:hypothetical protein
MKFRLNPRREVVAGTSDFPPVRSWKALLVAFKK